MLSLSAEAVDKRSMHPSSLAGLVMKKTNRDHRPRVGKKVRMEQEKFTMNLCTNFFAIDETEGYERYCASASILHAAQWSYSLLAQEAWWSNSAQDS